MKKIDTLIRLYKFELDEKRRALTDLENKMEQMIQARLMLDQELAAEQKTASAALELGSTYHAYSKKFIARREKMNKDLQELKIEIEKAEIIVQMAYQELKKYEITAERQAAREKMELNRKEQADADESGMQAFARKNKK